MAGFRRRRLTSAWREIPDFGIFQHAWEGLGTAAKVLAASAWSSSILLVVLAWGVDDLSLGSLLGILAGLDALGTLVLTYINVIRRNGDQHIRAKLQHALTYIPFCAIYVALVCAALCASVLVSNELLQETGEIGFSLLLALSGVGFLWAALIPWTFLASLAFEEIDEKSSKHVCLGQIVGILFYFVSAVVGLGISYLYSAVGWAGVVPTAVFVTMIVWLVCRVCLYKARNGRIIPIVFGLWLVFVVVCACNPEDDWPKVEALTWEDQEQRNAKWLPLILGVGTAGVLLGTGLTWLRDRFKRRLTNVETGTKDLQRLLQIITVPAVITTQVLALKVALYFNLTTKSQSGGLPFEGWLLFTTLSLLWLFTQTGESSNLGSNRTFGLESFGTALLSTIIPYFAEPFDVVKDAQFAAACCSSVSRVSQVVGIFSLNCIVISFLYRFKLEQQWLSMEESYVGFLHLKLADMVTASYWTRDPAKLAWREFLFRAYRRTLPAKQAWLVTEGAVQIPLTIIYLFAQPGSQKMILAMSVILPLIRLALVIPLRPFLLRRVAARVAVEFATAKAADIEELELRWMKELHELNSFDGAWQATAVIELAEEVGTSSSRILENLVEVLRRVPQPVPEAAILELCKGLPGSSRLEKQGARATGPGPEDLQRAKQLAKVLQAFRQRFPEAALVELCTATKYALEHPGLDPKLLQSLAEIWHSRRKQGFLGKAAGALKEVLEAAATSHQLTARESAGERGAPVSKGLLRFSKDLVVICCTTARSQAAKAQPPCNVKELLAGELFATRESGYQDLCSVLKRDLRDQVANSGGADLEVLRTQHQLLSNLTSPQEAGEELCRLAYWAAVRAHHLGLKAVVDILREQQDFRPEEASIGELCSAAAWDSVNKQEFAQRAAATTSASVPEAAGVVDLVREWLTGAVFPELAVQQILQAACLVAVKEYGKEQAHLAKSLVDVVKELGNRAPSQASLSLSELLKELVQLLVESPQVQALPTECLAHACKEAAKLAKLGKLRGFQGAAAFVDALSAESFPPESLQELCQAARQTLGPAPAEAEVVGSVATLLGVLAKQSQLEQVHPDGFADLAALAATASLRSDLKDLLNPLQKVLGRMVTRPLPPEPLASFSCAIVEARETTYAVDNLVQMLRCLSKGGSEESEPDSQEASSPAPLKTAVEHLIGLTSPVKALESLHQAAITAQVEPFALWTVLENKSAASPPVDADLTELCVRVSQEAAAGDFGKIAGQVKFLENLVKWRFPIDALPSLCSAAKCAAEAGAKELSGLVSTLEGQKELVLMWQERGDGADDLCAATVWAAVQGLPDFAKLKQLLEWLLAAPWQEGSATLKQALSRQPQTRPLLCRGVAAVTIILARDPGAGATCVTYMTELLDLLRDDSAAREISSVGVAGQAKDFVQRLLSLTTEEPLILELGAQALEAAKKGQVDHVVAFVRLVEPLRCFKPFPKGCVADLARAAGWLGAENCFVSFEEVLRLLQALPEDAFDEQGVEHFGRAVRLAALRGLDEKLLLGLAKSFGNLGQQEKLLREVKEDIRSGEKQHLTESLRHLRLLQGALEHPVS